MTALAYLYDHLLDLPAWLRQLRPRQLEDIAEVMVEWQQLLGDKHRILPMDEIEKREVIRALVLCGGSISKTAKMLNIGKSTIWRKLNQWGYSVQNGMLMEQASALSQRRDSPAGESSNAR
jgi:transcriptional regulator of acetoin/glycerol metabolism